MCQQSVVEKPLPKSHPLFPLPLRPFSNVLADNACADGTLRLYSCHPHATSVALTGIVYVVIDHISCNDQHCRGIQAMAKRNHSPRTEDVTSASFSRPLNPFSTLLFALCSSVNVDISMDLLLHLLFLSLPLCYFPFGILRRKRLDRICHEQETRRYDVQDAEPCPISSADCCA